MKNWQLTIIAILTLSSIHLNAQSPSGMNIYGGVSAMYNQEEVITPNGAGHYGYMLGVDARLNGGSLYFLFGGRYTSTSRAPEEGMTFFSNQEDHQLLTARAGFGFTIAELSWTSRVRSKVLASVTTPINSPTNVIDVPGYEILNDSWGGITTGIGLDLSAFTFDLEYHHGLINAYNGQPASKFNSYSFGVGFIF